MLLGCIGALLGCIARVCGFSRQYVAVCSFVRTMKFCDRYFHAWEGLAGSGALKSQEH